MLVDPVINNSVEVATNEIIPVTELEQLRHFAELGRLSASLIHEISNPLTTALLYLEQYDKQQPLNVRQARHNIMLLQRYVEAARQQFRGEGKIGWFYIRHQLDQVRRVLGPLARKRGVSLNIIRSPNYKLYGDSVKFQQILANLIINAIDSYDSIVSTYGKAVTVSLDTKDQWLVVRVHDHGKGIASENLINLFEAFYSTKQQTGQGLGIGLSAVKQYVENDFSGTIKATSSPRRGTEFTARLRIAPRYNKSRV